MKKTLIHIIFAVFLGFFFIPKTSANTEQIIQRNLNAYIFEVYKFQGSKILENLDTSIKKTFKTKEQQRKAFTDIQNRLIFRREQIKKNYKNGLNSKEVLIQYLEYLIQEMEKRKKSIK